jgi:hypothetical protein
MQRRGESEQPAKGRRTVRSKARKAQTAHVSAANLQEQLDRRTRELDEAIRQQTATSEVQVSKTTYNWRPRQRRLQRFLVGRISLTPVHEKKPKPQ